MVKLMTLGQGQKVKYHQIFVTVSISMTLYQTLCAFSQIKDRKHIEQNFFCCQGHAQGWYLGVLGESKTLARGFAMPLTAHSSSF